MGSRTPWVPDAVTAASHHPVRTSNRIRPGQELEIPGGSGTARAAAEDVAGPGAVYTVRSGDTLDSIARRHGTTPKSIAALNGLRNAHRIKPGQRLVLPGQ
jgi:LysM repeat protein